MFKLEKISSGICFNRFFFCYVIKFSQNNIARNFFYISTTWFIIYQDNNIVNWKILIICLWSAKEIDNMADLFICCNIGNDYRCNFKQQFQKKQVHLQFTRLIIKLKCLNNLLINNKEIYYQHHHYHNTILVNDIDDVKLMIIKRINTFSSLSLCVYV